MLSALKWVVSAILVAALAPVANDLYPKVKAALFSADWKGVDLRIPTHPADQAAVLFLFLTIPTIILYFRVSRGRRDAFSTDFATVLYGTTLATNLMVLSWAILWGNLEELKSWLARWPYLDSATFFSGAVWLLWRVWQTIWTAARRPLH